jgi:hypothetical protein
MRWDVLLLALIPLGLVAYALFLYFKFGDIMLWRNIHFHNELEQVWFWSSIQESFAIANIGKFFPVISTYDIRNIYQIFFALSFTLVAIASWFRLGPAYASFILLGMILPLSGGGLLSTHRFLVVLFPAFMQLAEWGKNKSFDRFYTIGALLMLAYFTIAYVGWQYGL